MLTSKDHTVPCVILRMILTTALKQGLGGIVGICVPVLLACDQHGEGTLMRNQQWRAGKRETRMPAAFRKCALASSSRVTVVGSGRMGSLRARLCMWA